MVSATTPRRPKWVVVRDALAEAFAGQPEGTALPSESQLCDRFDVSRVTIRRAVDDLERAGRIVRQHGRGMFVGNGHPPAGHPQEHLDLTGFHRQMTDQGRLVRSAILRQGVVRAPVDVATHLRLPAGSEVVRLERLRYVDGTLDHLTSTWVDAARFPTVATADFRDRSLFTHLHEEYGLTLVEDQILASMRIIGGTAATHLKLTPGSPALSTVSTAFDAAGAPRVHAHTTFASPTATLSFTVRTTP